MLLAVEGGRFFSSSASGYSNGLNLLILGQKKEEKPMRVTPWAQYRLVDHGPDSDLQLAANKNRCACGCASFTCFGCAATGADSPSVGPTQHQQDHVVKSCSGLEKVDENFQVSNLDERDRDTDGVNVISLKSSLKKRASNVTDPVGVKNCDEVQSESGPEVGPDVGPVYQSGRRSVHWTDVTGGELCEIREFEPSEDSDSDNEFENSTGKTCACTIM